MSRVGTDTRRLEGKELFVALAGDRFDGHAFLRDAVEKGASAALVEKGVVDNSEFRKRFGGFPLVTVGDTLTALGDLAKWVRGRLDLVAVGITGSTGKTCTKDLLLAALKKNYRVTGSPGSYNNEVGVPLTVFRATGRDRYLVTEMGARHPGDIEKLARIVKPEQGIITNVGVTHIEMFKSERGIAGVKAELALSIPAGGNLFLSADNRWSDWIAERSEASVVRFGRAASADYRVRNEEIDEEGHPSFVLEGPGFEVGMELGGMVGLHQVDNAAAAASCAHRLGVEPESIAEAFRGARLSSWRMEVLECKGHYTVVNDSYNANPRSMAAALEAIASMAEGRRTIAVLGPMAELGRRSEKYHLEAGRDLARVDVDILITVGEKAKGYAEGALGCGMPRGSIFESKSAGRALELLSCIVEPGDVILVKASRFMELERVAQALVSEDFADMEGRAVTDV